MKNYFLRLFIYLTFIISLFLQTLFIKNNNIILHIPWLTLILIYWIIKYPYIINIITSFLIGLIIDFFTNYILGIHSLLLCILTYFLLYNYKSIINLNIIFKLLFIIYTSFIINIIIYYINDINFHYRELFLQGILNSFIWIVIYYSMDKFYYKCQKYFFS
ncbi:rod shape-determining protein MreD [Enterobacteriaceae endosymbiont of Donacia thalassina]|uniref:rod shape-determining protein MreD n=1 Tax=Enterobacteriaceae endosymbiont of Donacia thalassina TaxID=2675786 RepID=UPI00144A0C75|nr:rod shape-determining protein MreD [Enterobacteriaceae endosymbiont of Donacia thalassina]QJC37147.1 rod shape-determining protein MreD [Enterobacteriaceae endosymbiont of Donacia thalassina]